MDTKTKIRSFLQNKIGGNANLADDDNIFALGLVNSLFALQLILFIEESFKVVVTNEDLKLETFSAVNSISAFIQSKLSEQPS